MKHAKTVGFALAASLAIVAFLGVGTASATVLCEATETPCGESNLLHPTAEINADLLPGTSVRFETTFGFVIATCTGSSFVATVEKAGGASETTVVGVPSAGFTWSGCTSGISTALSGEWEIHHKEGTDNGTLTNTKNLFGKQFGITLDVLNGCTYLLYWTGHIGAVTGGAEGSGEWAGAPRVDIHARLGAGAGESCLEDIIWRATYSLTSPAPMYVRPS